MCPAALAGKRKAKPLICSGPVLYLLHIGQDCPGPLDHYHAPGGPAVLNISSDCDILVCWYSELQHLLQCKFLYVTVT